MTPASGSSAFCGNDLERRRFAAGDIDHEHAVSTLDVSTFDHNLSAIG
jgi:hypothetical protein